MSYNIDNVEAKLTNAKILLKTLKSLYKKYQDELPSTNFLEDHLDDAPDDKGYIKLKNVDWCDSYSGHSYELLTDKILPKTVGKMELILTWEGGESTSGLLVENGIVTECNVEMVLVPIVDDE